MEEIKKGELVPEEVAPLEQESYKLQVDCWPDEYIDVRVGEKLKRYRHGKTYKLTTSEYGAILDKLDSLMEDVTVELGRGSSKITINGIDYHHGQTLRCSRATAVYIRDMNYRSQVHDAAIAGANGTHLQHTQNEHLYRRASPLYVGPGGNRTGGLGEFKTGGL